ncbi:hypothetical protein BKA63DRAFT_537843 [Paraphoma chrysanthemicola]|nr:hypothetical protein BKA63DRAFT_537843 [Paraphoma chrysanthemicola]
MSRKWTPSIYRTHDAQTSAPDVGEIDSLLRAVEVYSGRLRSSPYDHHLWLGRARCYLALNYPELAVGDAYKAGLLLDEHEDAAGGDMNLTRMHVHSVVSQALYDCHCHCELVEFWDEVSAAFPSEHASKEAIRMKQLLKQKKEASYPLGGTRWEQRDRVRDGGTVTVTYPWMEERHLTRSSALVEKINGELGDDIEQRSCTLGRSTLDSRDNMLGMFAAKNIQPGECVLIDRPATGATSSPDDSACGNCYGFVPSQPISAPCCAVVYCSSACLDLAMSSYHRLLCGQNFDWLQQPAIGLTHNASPLRPLLMLRLLAICVQAGVDKHPLDHSLIARLQPLLDCAHVDVFTFNESVKTPIKILQQLGVDVFAAHNLDTMVLHTIWTRLANNKAGSSDPMRGFIDEISSHLPLFNHSCESNVEWKREDGKHVTRTENPGIVALV